MKDGTVAETGTHEELMLRNGDYAKLYNIQASAFLSEGSSLVEGGLRDGDCGEAGIIGGEL